MKDLKNMIYYEELLEEANNDLVRQAKAEGRHPVGYTCFHIPEAVLNVDNCFSVRLRAPKMGSTEIATYYLASSSCEFSRAILERSIEGGFNFLDAWAGLDACECMNRCIENADVHKFVGKGNDKFFTSYVDIPAKSTGIFVKHVTTQIRHHILDPLHENYGVDTSDEALRKAVEQHNEICRIITEIGEYRKLDNPTITGSEFHKICLASYVCPKDLIVGKLRETLEDLKTREPDEKKKFRARVVVIGGEIDDPEMIELIEDSGALVVADRFCYGSIPGRQEIILNDEEDVLTQIVRTNLEQTSCPRFANIEKINYRQEQAQQLVKDFHADGIIYEQIKFCSFWSYERTLESIVLREDFGIPTLSIDRPYRAGQSGQIRTRVQAFVESMEIKKIKAVQKAEGVK